MTDPKPNSFPFPPHNGEGCMPPTKNPNETEWQNIRCVLLRDGTVLVGDVTTYWTAAEAVARRTLRGVRVDVMSDMAGANQVQLLPAQYIFIACTMTGVLEIEWTPQAEVAVLTVEDADGWRERLRDVLAPDCPVPGDWKPVELDDE